MKQCPNNADCTKANFNKCIRDYLEAVAGFLNIGNQLIRWLRTSKKPALMPMHEFMWRQVQLLSYLEGGYLRQTIVNKSSLCSPRRIRTSSPTWTRRCLLTRSRWLPSLSSVRQPTRRLAFSRRLPRIKSSQRKGKWLSFLSHVAVNQATINIAVINIAIITKVTNATAMINNPTMVIKTIGVTIVLNAMTRTWGATSPMTRRMIASAITSRKRMMSPCTMTSPQAPAICPKEGVDLVPDHLWALFLVFGLALAQAAGATATIMLIKMTASLVQHSSKGIHPSTGTCTPPRVMTADAFIAQTKAILGLPPSLLQKQRRSAPRNRESC